MFGKDYSPTLNSLYKLISVFLLRNSAQFFYAADTADNSYMLIAEYAVV